MPSLDVCSVCSFTISPSLDSTYSSCQSLTLIHFPLPLHESAFNSLLSLCFHPVLHISLLSLCRIIELPRFWIGVLLLLLTWTAHLKTYFRFINQADWHNESLLYIKEGQCKKIDKNRGYFFIVTLTRMKIF